MEDVHVFTVLRKSDVMAGTFDAIWKVLAWDMGNMYRGTFAVKRHDFSDLLKYEFLRAVKGESIAAGARFAINQLKQDWEFIANVYGFKSWSKQQQSRWSGLYNYTSL